METKLKALFDFQKFADNPALQGVIDSVHTSQKSRRRLSLDEANWVAAAGEPEISLLKKAPEEDPS